MLASLNIMEIVTTKHFELQQSIFSQWQTFPPPVVKAVSSQEQTSITLSSDSAILRINFTKQQEIPVTYFFRVVF